MGTLASLIPEERLIALSLPPHFPILFWTVLPCSPSHSVSQKA